jgi:methanogenic corrinoid protein MtbC1
MDNKYLELINSIEQGDVDLGIAESVKLVEAGTDPVSIFLDCIQPTLNEIGEKFSRMELFLPDLMVAGEVVNAIQEKLLPYMKEGENASIKRGRGVIATAYGDLHDIGKNMVCLMMQVNGFEMKDLGVDVSSATIIKAAEDFNADLVMISGLMLPSLPYMKDTIDQIKGNPKLANRFKILVGGGPVTREWAMNAGADGYSDDALGAVKEALEVLSK